MKKDTWEDIGFKERERASNKNAFFVGEGHRVIEQEGAGI